MDNREPIDRIKALVSSNIIKIITNGKKIFKKYILGCV